MSLLRRLIVVLTVLIVTPTYSAPLAVVDGAQFPAWLEHGGARQPVKPGMALNDGDVLHTGTEGRIFLGLDDGSTIKLGENANFSVGRLNRRTEHGNATLFAALEVLKGAFRFTTDIVAGGRRDVRIRVGAATIGIRGTDVWGRSNDEKDFICLIEGQITLTAENRETTLREPLAFFNKLKGAASDPIGKLDLPRLAKLAEETEMATGNGTARTGGLWKVNVFSSPYLREAMLVQARLRTQGYPAELSMSKPEGRERYLLRIENILDKEGAESLAIRIKTQFGFDAVAGDGF